MGSNSEKVKCCLLPDLCMENMKIVFNKKDSLPVIYLHLQGLIITQGQHRVSNVYKEHNRK